MLRRPVIESMACSMIIMRHMKEMRIEELPRPIPGITNLNKESNVMPKAKKTIKVRDQKPQKDPKGGGRGHAVNTGGGKNINRHHPTFAPN
jgi:hypothetical protein